MIACERSYDFMLANGHNIFFYYLKNHKFAFDSTEQKTSEHQLEFWPYEYSL